MALSKKFVSWTAKDREIPRPPPLTVKKDLQVGNVYRVNGEKMTLIGKYERFARFEGKNGIKFCYLYNDLQYMTPKIERIA